jgi:uncharacterized protein
MTVQHKKSDGKGMFYVEYDDEIAAEMVYTTAADKMIIEHTEVDEILKGRNTGYELVHAAVEYARHHGMKIIPLCSFAKSVLDKKPDWQDVLG